MLGDDIAAKLPQLRAHARSRMWSTALVEQVEVGADPDTGMTVETVASSQFLPCRVKHGRMVRPADVQGAQVAEVPTEIHFPWDTEGLQVGLRVTITTSESPMVQGAVLRLTGPPQGDQMTAQRWGAESWAPQTN